MDKKGFKKNPTEFFISAAEEANEESTENPSNEQKKKAKAAQTRKGKSKKSIHIQDKSAILEEKLSDVIPKGYKIKRESKSQRMQLLIRPSTYNELKAKAKENQISINELVNIIFERYLGIEDSI